MRFPLTPNPAQNRWFFLFSLQYVYFMAHFYAHFFLGKWGRTGPESSLSGKKRGRNGEVFWGCKSAIGQRDNHRDHLFEPPDKILYHGEAFFQGGKYVKKKKKPTRCAFTHRIGYVGRQVHFRIRRSDLKFGIMRKGDGVAFIIAPSLYVDWSSDTKNRPFFLSLSKHNAGSYPALLFL